MPKIPADICRRMAGWSTSNGPNDTSTTGILFAGCSGAAFGSRGIPQFFAYEGVVPGRENHAAVGECRQTAISVVFLGRTPRGLKQPAGQDQRQDPRKSPIWTATRSSQWPVLSQWPVIPVARQSPVAGHPSGPSSPWLALLILEEFSVGPAIAPNSRRVGIDRVTQKLRRPVSKRELSSATVKAADPPRRTIRGPHRIPRATDAARIRIRWCCGVWRKTETERSRAELSDQGIRLRTACRGSRCSESCCSRRASRCCRRRSGSRCRCDTRRSSRILAQGVRAFDDGGRDVGNGWLACS